MKLIQSRNLNRNFSGSLRLTLFSFVSVFLKEKGRREVLRSAGAQNNSLLFNLDQDYWTHRDTGTPHSLTRLHSIFDDTRNLMHKPLSLCTFAYMLELKAYGTVVSFLKLNVAYQAKTCTYTTADLFLPNVAQINNTSEGAASTPWFCMIMISYSRETVWENVTSHFFF